MADQDAAAAAVAKPVMNRWLVVVGAILIQLCLGAIYAWSVFTPGLKATMPRDIALTYRAGMLELSAEEIARIDTLAHPGGRIVSPDGLAPDWD